MIRALVLVAAAVLSFGVLCGPAWAGTEARCTSLGANCLCGEPMNTSTHDGGNATWTTPGAFNLDDSPSASECGATRGAENYCASQLFAPTPAASEVGKLPAGHALSSVLHHVGAGICHLSHPPIVEAPDVTYCARAYRRWDATSQVPGDPSLLQQQKVLTIGGAPAGTNDYLNAQISLDSGGNLHTRFDGNLFDAPVDFSSLGTMTDCIGNYCRFEICVDYSSIGEGRVRLSRTKVSPGDGTTKTVVKPVGNVRRPTGIDLTWVPGGVSLYAQNIIANSYNTHFLVSHVRPENRAFWIGPACEVEGGCGGVTPPPIVQRTLTVTQSGTGLGTTTGAGTYADGTVVTLMATPQAGSTFAGLSGDPDCVDLTVTLDANKTCIATFTAVAPPPAGPTITSVSTGCRFVFTVNAPGASSVRLLRDGIASGKADQSAPFVFSREWGLGTYQVAADVAMPTGTVRTPAMTTTCP